MKLKQDLLNICFQHVNKRISDYNNEITLIKESIESNDKVSNEEDDSGNSKLLDDLEKNMNYLNEAQKTKEHLGMVKPNLVSDTVVLGSIVKTDSINFFIATSIGKVDLDKDEYYIISILSPIGQLMKLKGVGHSFEFNGKHYKIKTVL